MQVRQHSWGVNLYDLGFDVSSAAPVARVDVEIGDAGVDVLVERDGEKFRFAFAGDELVERSPAAPAPLPRWMPAVLDFVGLDVTEVLR